MDPSFKIIILFTARRRPPPVTHLLRVDPNSTSRTTEEPAPRPCPNYTHMTSERSTQILAESKLLSLPMVMHIHADAPPNSTTLAPDAWGINKAKQMSPDWRPMPRAPCRRSANIYEASARATLGRGPRAGWSERDSSKHHDYITS